MGKSLWANRSPYGTNQNVSLPREREQPVPSQWRGLSQLPALSLSPSSSHTTRGLANMPGDTPAFVSKTTCTLTNSDLFAPLDC